MTVDHSQNKIEFAGEHFGVIDGGIRQEEPGLAATRRNFKFRLVLINNLKDGNVNSNFESRIILLIPFEERM